MPPSFAVVTTVEQATAPIRAENSEVSIGLPVPSLRVAVEVTDCSSGTKIPASKAMGAIPAGFVVTLTNPR